MKDNLTEIKKSLESKVESLQQGKDSVVEVDNNIDWYLAYYVYNFLSGKSTKLPSYEFIDDVINDANIDVVSMGYGIRIDKHLHISCTNMITSNLERVDIITPTDYRAFTTDTKEEVLDVDVDSYPIYDKNRVDYLKQYMYEYFDYKKDNKSVKEKTK